METLSARGIATRLGGRRRASEGDSVAVPWADWVIFVATSLLAVYLGVEARWAPGAMLACMLLLALAAGLPLLRGLAHTFPRIKAFDFLACFWLFPVVAVGHGALQAAVDAAHPVLLDAYLARADLWLFGAFPSAVIDHYLGRWEMDVLLFCYYSYYVWPMILGFWLYAAKQRRAFQHFVLALALAFTVNYLFYVLVPAIGPRFYLSHDFAGPLQGLYLTPILDSLMRKPPFMRDCFPSGHTAITLVALTFAFRYARKFFWVMLPVACGLILATLAGRFHYGIDVICAVPMALAVIAVADLIVHRWPDGARVLVRHDAVTA